MPPAGVQWANESHGALEPLPESARRLNTTPESWGLLTAATVPGPDAEAETVYVTRVKCAVTVPVVLSVFHASKNREVLSTHPTLAPERVQ
jgi:hypothetical protein